MKAIESIKNQISEAVKFNFKNVCGTYPDLSWVGEMSTYYHSWVREGISKMEKSHLFTETEINEVSSYAVALVSERAFKASHDLKAAKRESYKF